MALYTSAFSVGTPCIAIPGVGMSRCGSSAGCGSCGGKPSFTWIFSFAGLADGLASRPGRFAGFEGVQLLRDFCAAFLGHGCSPGFGQVSPRLLLEGVVPPIINSRGKRVFISVSSTGPFSGLRLLPNDLKCFPVATSSAQKRIPSSSSCHPQVS